MARVATEADAEEAIRLILEGASMYKACLDIGCDYPSMSRLLSTPQYSARSKDARRLSADAQELLAFEALYEIPDGADKATVARQVALSQRHARAAATRDPQTHGDSVQVVHQHKVDLMSAIEDGVKRAQSVIDGCITVNQEVLPLPDHTDR